MENEILLFMSCIVLRNTESLLIPILDKAKAKTPWRGAGTYSGVDGVSVNVAIRP